MANLTYLSVCSGIEAASQAWKPLGWRLAAVSEIDPFPCSVLHHHHGAGRPMFMPDPAQATKFADRRARQAAIKRVVQIPEFGAVPNFGDMNRFKEWPDVPTFDVLVGGTPCQSFSVAGLRKGLDDPRGNLALTYLALADRYRPDWLVWENVPGVLSSNKGRDFGAFLGGLGQLGYGWAYRVLDAQFVRTRRFLGAVPQRRRRVFVVASARGWQRAAAVLFDSESLRGNPPPRRQQWERSASTLAARTRGGGELGSDFDLDGGLISMAHGQAGAEICFDHSPTMSCNHEPPIVAFDALSGWDMAGWSSVNVAGTLHRGGKHGCRAAITFEVKGGLGPDGKGWRDDGADYTLEARTVTQEVAFQDLVRGDDGRGYDLAPAAFVDVCGTLETVKRHTIALPWAVRRLTPRECERLHRFPDDYTLVPVGNKLAVDGPRYKALGNSMAVNVMEWIGHRIDMLEGLDL